MKKHRHNWGPWFWTFIGRWKGENRHGYSRVCLRSNCFRYQQAAELAPAGGVRSKREGA